MTLRLRMLTFLGATAVLAGGQAHAFGLLDAYMAARQYDPQYRSA